MSAQDFSDVFKKQSEFQLGLASQLISVNIGTLEKLTASHLALVRRLVEESPKFSSRDPNLIHACCVGVGVSFAEYWKERSLEGLEYQHQVLQALLRRAAR